MTHLASVRLSFGVTFHAKDASGSSWTMHRDEAHRFSDRITAADVAFRWAKEKGGLVEINQPCLRAVKGIEG